MGSVTLSGREVYSFEGMRPSLYHLLAETAARTPDAIAVVDDWGRKTSFAELLAHVDNLAGLLVSEAKVAPGSRVGLLMHADLEFVVALFAISKAGATCVPVPTKYREPEVVSLMQAADLTALVAGEEFERWVPSLPLRPSEIVFARGVEDGYGFAEAEGFSSLCEPTGGLDDAAIMMFTSGTTSRAKGVVLTNGNVIHAAMVYQRLMGTTPADSCLIPIPIYHVTGLIALLIQFVYVGATTYLHRLFDARRVLACVRDRKITYLHGSPTSFAELLPLRGEFPELPSVRCMLSGSSYEPVGTMRQFHQWMPTATFQVVYGMTETASPALLFPLDSPTSVFAGATGKPVPGVDAKIVDERGHEVPWGETGELLLRGACVTAGYFRHDNGEIEPDGWLHTGDMGTVSADGTISIRGRSKTMILSANGQNIYPEEIEAKLNNMPFVMESLVVERGDKLVALVYPDYEMMDNVGLTNEQLPTTMEQIRKDLNKLVAPYEQIAKIQLIANEFEKTPKRSIKRYLYQ